MGKVKFSKMVDDKEYLQKPMYINWYIAHDGSKLPDVDIHCDTKEELEDLCKLFVRIARRNFPSLLDENA